MYMYHSTTNFNPWLTHMYTHLYESLLSTTDTKHYTYVLCVHGTIISVHLIAVYQRLNRLHTDLGHLDVDATPVRVLRARHGVVFAVIQIRQL